MDQTQQQQLNDENFDQLDDEQKVEKQKLCVTGRASRLRSAA